MTAASSSSSSLSYDSLRASLDNSLESRAQRVEVNQRALIDKILARYASANAVYRELLQNSNDAEASRAEIHFSCSEEDAAAVVTQVLYRNNGMAFRPQDWQRLQKIAEGNPDEKKIGAFGVGAYTMFSICEEPMVISGGMALAFVWKGDALWTKTTQTREKDDGWTSFVLPSRDPYALPDLVEFGQFLCANLTFTQCLTTVKLYVNGKERLVIDKTVLRPPTVVTPPKSSSWFKNDGAVTQTPQGLFTLQTKGILDSMQQVRVTLDGVSSQIQARYVSGTAKTRIPSDMVKRIERVTKKKPPSEVTVQLFLNAQQDENDDTHNTKSKAYRITQSFRPQMGAGRVFIGFRTSQTTGLAAHLAAPLIPTVEREAIDLQEPTLKIFNVELLEFSGILLRLMLEHGMSVIGQEYVQHQEEREALEQKLLAEADSTSAVAEQAGTLQSQASDTGDDDDDDDDDDNDTTTKSSNNKDGSDDRSTKSSSSSSRVLSFARFMAKGVKKSIVSVMSTASAVLADDGSAELLNPRDPRPLSSQEQHAILLMRSFCPQQSTPDTLVGTALAQGFSRCMPNATPPVLTRSGVMRGTDARLPNQGMEAFCPKQMVVRRIMYQNAQEYHDVLARCRPLKMEDVSKNLSSQVLDQKQVVRFLQWWTKYTRIDPHVAPRGKLLKESIRYLPEEMGEVGEVQHLKDRLYYEDPKVFPEGLPMPPSVLAKDMQAQTTIRILSDVALKTWFYAIPMETWARYISNHPCMTAGQPEDEKLRVTVLSILSKEYSRRALTERVLFASFLSGLLSDKRCIPFDSQEPTRYAAERPSDLYLNSAQLKAFEGIGFFHKVSQSLKDEGVSDDFLLALGVRKSVAVDFLFSNLDSLSWKDDPKPLIEYLRSAILTGQDMEKLRTTQYLPAENDITRTFAPSELYLPNPELRVFPFLKLLQWPSDDEPTERTANGKFLVKLGCQVRPPLVSLLQYVSDEVKDDKVRLRCLDYVVKNLGSGGHYEKEYSKIRASQALRNYRFLPCARRDVLVSNKLIPERQSPLSCYSDSPCIVMGFSVVDPATENKNGHLLGNRFRCDQEPDASTLLRQLEHLVAAAKMKLREAKGSEAKKLRQHILAAFGEIFKYMSTRSTEFDARILKALQAQSFIPCEVKNDIQWYRPTEVYFKGSNDSEDSLTQALFHVIDFSPFLAAAGVRSEANTHDLFNLMLSSPDRVLRTLGSEDKYRTLLRRIAANPPFRRVTPEIQNAPFLLAYKIIEGEAGQDEKNTFVLAKAADIYIIDNSFFGRMFNVIRAPHESDLEDFYVSLGSSYISKKVSTRYEVMGREQKGTSLTVQLEERIQERRPLIVSPTVTSRPLVSDASTVLDPSQLQIVEVDSLKAVYSLGRAVRNQRVTCCSKPSGVGTKGLYVSESFDWFDVGNAIGNLILQRCQLEDAFFIGSLLEAPLEQLRARGFPVDRILRPPEPMIPEPASEPEAPPAAVAAAPSARVTDAPAGAAVTTATVAPPVAEEDEGFETILHQMFPDCSEDFLRAKLGNNPDLDVVRELAEELSSGNYPRKAGKDGSDLDAESVATAATQSTQSTGQTDGPKKPPKSPDSHGKRGLGKRLGRAFSGRRGSSGGGLGGGSSGADGPLPQTHRVQAPAPIRFPSSSNDGLPVPPEADQTNHQSMEQLLKHSVDQSTKVNARGVNSAETVLTQVPDGLDRGSDGCEILPGHALKPFPGQYRSGKTHNGIRVFSAKLHPQSESFLQKNFHAVDSFGDVLEQLCNVYSLSVSTVAIFYDPTGGTIAFNANRALHFNLRFYFALHYGKPELQNECYSYWYTTFAHELAHHLVSAHNKEHGFYTESFVTSYLPKFVSLLRSMEERRRSKK